MSIESDTVRTFDELGYAWYEWGTPVTNHRTEVGQV
jgi:hypothetical protein